MRNIKTEAEIRDMIRASAEQVEIPEGLRPEAVEAKLRKQRTQDAAPERISAGKAGKRRNYQTYVAAAAALLVICSLGIAGGGKWLVKNSREDSAQEKMVIPGNSWGYTGDQDSKGENEEGAVIQESAEETVEVLPEEELWQQRKELAAAPGSNAGDVYRTAESYEKAYEALEKYGDTRVYYETVDDGAMSSGTGGAVDFLGGVPEAPSSAKTDSAVQSGTAAEVNESMEDYSTTNLQTEGVDESDIIKTDGEYLYIVKGHEVEMLDIRGGEPRKAYTVTLPESSDSTQILELYVSNGELVIISVRNESSLEKSSAGAFYTKSSRQTVCHTYTLREDAEPVLAGEVSQDGTYHTSRKIGDVLYLFTFHDVMGRLGTADPQSADWVPQVDGAPIAYDSIYIPEAGGYALTISSIVSTHPDEVLDSVMIINDYAQVYVSTDAVYLYRTEYEKTTSGFFYRYQSDSTEIAKFSISDGIIDGVNAVSVKGKIQDSFAIYEKGDNLCVLTTDNDSNNLFVYDYNLKKIGSLQGIAPGERIYAARYLGDMVYFVTYRQVDPLFAVDLSDPAKPVILGELKITGYSEYLHGWKDGLMVGIGYETDPDTGRQEGLKLSMFDVSDPASLSAVACELLANYNYSPALYEYKTVLVDAGKNLIGFVAEGYSKDHTVKYFDEFYSYLLYRYDNGQFTCLLEQPVEKHNNDIRGIYVGDYFYIVTPQSVLSYKLGQELQPLGEYRLQ